MAIIDYAVIGIIAVSALIGLSRGFVREVLSLAIWGLAVMLALTFSGTVAAALPKRVEGEPLRFIVAFALVFVGALIAGGLVQWLLRQLVESTGLSGTDRLVGLIFGGLRGAVICIVAVIAIRPLAAEQSWWQTSRSVPVLETFESQVSGAMSFVGDWFERMRQKR